MIRLLILLIFFFPNLNYGQYGTSSISGNWVLQKAEMKDGSKLFDRFMNDSTHLVFTISKNKLCMNSDPLKNSNSGCIECKMSNDIIKTSQYAAYFIEEASNDSLVLSEKINDLTDDKLKRMYFVRQEILISAFKEKNKEKKDIIASKVFSPKEKKPIGFALNKAFKNNYSNFRLKGNIKIYLNEKKIKSEILFSTSKDSSKIKTIKHILDTSFENWDMEQFAGYDSVELPFILKSETTKFYRGINIRFFENDINEFDTVYGGKYEDIRKGNEYFQKGIDAYLKKNYPKAIEYFSESYKSDPKNLEALYNKAAVYYESGDIQNACKTWKEISKLGQKKAEEFYKLTCN